jgi:hypothetical protein
MKLMSLVKFSFAITTGAAMLAACSNSGGSSLGPSGTSPGMAGISHIGKAVMLNGHLITAFHPNLNAHQGGVFSSDQKRTLRNSAPIEPSQYISSFDNSSLMEFDYPKSDQQVGTITGVAFPQGECTTGKDTFWVTAFNGIEEFQVGDANPIQVLPSFGAGGCAIDPATGNLAATSLSSGDVTVFTGASGSGTVMATPLSEAYFAGYDGKGNLYVDGLTANFTFGLVELPKGSSSFVSMTTTNNVELPGGVQWDGRYITVNDQDSHSMYGYTCSGTSCALAETVSLSGSSDCVQTWIEKSMVLCPDAGNDDLEVYNYPAGGAAISTLTASFSLPIGAVKVEK